MIYCCCWWLHDSLALHTALGRTISRVWKPELCLWFAYFVFEYILGVCKTKFKENNFSFFTCSCWSWNINLFSLFKWLTGKKNNFFVTLVDVNTVWTSEIQSDLIMREKVYYVVYQCTLKGRCVLKLTMKQINIHFLQEIFVSESHC